jgi:sortase A
MLLAVLKRAFLIVGAGALTYAGALMTESFIEQRYETLKFDRALALPVSSRPDVVVPGGPIGKLAIPAAGISVIVLEGTDTGTLNVAPGHVPGTALPSDNGNVAIAGHRDTFFRNLEKIRYGDSVTLTTLGAAYHYKVDSIDIVDPSRTDVLAPTGRATLTLVTCYPFHRIGPAPKRFIVRGHLVNKVASNRSETYG